MALLLYLLHLLFLLPLMVYTANDTVLCEPGELEDCSKCYVFLVEQITKHDKNLYAIQKAFFPPDDESPYFVTVIYTFEDEDSMNHTTEIWFWSTSTFYLYQPLHVFQFTSLFFSDTQLEVTEVHLTLPMECSHASRDHKQLLTQRLKVYATGQSIFFPIDDNYNPKAETLQTLEDWHTNHTSYSGYITFNFVAFPCFSWCFLLLIIVYINTCAPQPRIKRFKSILEENNKEKAWSCKLHLQNEFTLSLTFVLFSFCLAASAVAFGEKTASKFSPELREYFSLTSSLHIGFRRIFSLGYVLVIQDAVILLIMVGCIAVIPFSKHCKETPDNSSKNHIHSPTPLTTITENLVTAATELSIPDHEAALQLTEAATKLTRDAIISRCRPDPEWTTKITQAIAALQSVKRTFNRLSEVAKGVDAASRTYESEAVKQQEMQEEVVTVSWDILETELKKLAKNMEKFKIPTNIEVTLCNLKRIKEEVDQPTPRQQQQQPQGIEDSEPLMPQEPPNEQIELEDVADSFSTTSRSLQDVVDTLKHSLDDLFQNMVFPMSIDQLESLITSVKCIAVNVVTRQTQVNSLSLAVFSLVTAADELVKNIEETTIKVTENTAKIALGIAIMNINAAELTIATSTLAREAIDITELRIKLTKIEDNLTTASNSISDYDCAWHLTATAMNLTELAKMITPSAQNRRSPMIIMVKQLATAATNFATAASYVLNGNRSSVFDKLEEARGATKHFTKTASDLISEPKERILWYWWWFCAYSMLFPLCCLLNHFNYIIIAFIHNLYHATGVAIAYGVIVIFLYLMLDNIPHIFPNNKHLLLYQVIKISAVCVLILYLASDIVLYFYIPIDKAFDDAANHFISMYNTTAVFFTGIVLYLFIRQPSRSPIKILTLALDRLFYKDEKATQLSIRKEDWKRLSDRDKDIEVAKSLLKKIE